MNGHRFGILACMALLAAAVAVKAADAIGQVGKEYFTKVNIWFEKKDNIPTTNYHRGLMMPLGTKVRIASMGKGKIQFTDMAANVTYTLVHNTKHNPGDLAMIFAQYFSDVNVVDSRGLFEKFSRSEKENIKAGKVETGMCKDAVLAAYGNPPGHVTPALTYDTWVYWNSRAERLQVKFENDKVKETVIIRGP